MKKNLLNTLYFRPPFVRRMGGACSRRSSISEALPQGPPLVPAPLCWHAPTAGYSIPIGWRFAWLLFRRLSLWALSCVVSRSRRIPARSTTKLSRRLSNSAAISAPRLPGRLSKLVRTFSPSLPNLIFFFFFFQPPNIGDYCRIYEQNTLALKNYLSTIFKNLKILNTVLRLF